MASIPLDVGMIGYGFMGRAHSNAYHRLSDFFPELGHRPVLKAACGRSAESVEAFATTWGYQSVETDWRELIARRDIDAVGSGVTGDLLAHNIHTAMWLNGPITRVMAETETLVTALRHQETGEMAPVGIDDACMFMARFANGAMGVFESTRYARGHEASRTLELNGDAGSLAFNLHDDQWQEFLECRAPENGAKIPGHLVGWRRIHVTTTEHPYMDHWWVPGLTIASMRVGANGATAPPVRNAAAAG